MLNFDNEEVNEFPPFPRCNGNITSVTLSAQKHNVRDTSVTLNLAQKCNDRNTTSTLFDLRQIILKRGNGNTVNKNFDLREIILTKESCKQQVSNLLPSTWSMEADMNDLGLQQYSSYIAKTSDIGTTDERLNSCLKTAGKEIMSFHKFEDALNIPYSSLPPQNINPVKTGVRAAYKYYRGQARTSAELAGHVRDMRASLQKDTIFQENKLLKQTVSDQNYQLAELRLEMSTIKEANKTLLEANKTLSNDSRRTISREQAAQEVYDSFPREHREKFHETPHELVRDNIVSRDQERKRKASTLLAEEKQKEQDDDKLQRVSEETHDAWKKQCVVTEYTRLRRQEGKMAAEGVNRYTDHNLSGKDAAQLSLAAHTRMQSHYSQGHRFNQSDKFRHAHVNTDKLREETQRSRSIPHSELEDIDGIGRPTSGHRHVPIAIAHRSCTRR